jgi:hypothetical protein
VNHRSDRELLAGNERRHSNLDDAEFDCHVFSKARALRIGMRRVRARACT